MPDTTQGKAAMVDARMLVAQAWYDPRTRNRVMDPELAEVLAEMLVRDRDKMAAEIERLNDRVAWMDEQLTNLHDPFPHHAAGTRWDGDIKKMPWTLFCDKVYQCERVEAWPLGWMIVFKCDSGTELTVPFFNSYSTEQAARDAAKENQP